MIIALPKVPIFFIWNLSEEYLVI